MRLNEKEVMGHSLAPASKEGRIYHKNPSAGFREGYKERWFKLIGNLLYYFRVNEYGGVQNKDPAGVLLIETCKAMAEDNASLPFAFSIVFDNEPDKKHILGCPNQKQCDDWVVAINAASYQHQKQKLLQMREKIIQMTGTDPLPKLSYR